MKLSVTCFSLIGLFLISCQSVSYVTIEVKRPAEIVFPDNVRKVVIVSNTVDQSENYGHKAFSFNGGSSKEAGLKLKTTGIPDFYAQTLASRLNTLHWFKLYNQSLAVSKSFLEITPLTEDQFREIQDSTQADLIISIDRLLIQSTTILTERADQFPAHVAMTGIITPTVRIYSTENRNIISTIQGQDSLFWESYGISAASALESFPSFQNCFEDLASYSAERLMKKLVPYSERVDRYYYIGGDLNLKDASVYVRQNRWSEASYIWDYLYTKTKRYKIKAYAAANMALYCEISDKYDEAIDWAEKSMSYFHQIGSDRVSQEISNLSQYIDELKQRQADAPKLDLQLPSDK